METAESITCLALFFKDSSGGEATEAGGREWREAEREPGLRRYPGTEEDRTGEIV